LCFYGLLAAKQNWLLDMKNSPGSPSSRCSESREFASGMCAELLPERITLDEWGYPLIDEEPCRASVASRL
jgi:hypothetical protein